MKIQCRLACLPLAALALWASSAFAATLMVGPEQAYKSIAAAADAANSGDTIRIEPGTYHACADFTADNLTIEGVGAGPLFAGAVCRNEGIFVIQGDNVTIRNIQFADAVSSHGNGAGIRAHGGRLVVEKSRFTNNQNGILTDNKAGQSLEVRDSVFEGNGTCVSPLGCAHGIYAGHIALLRVSHSQFRDTKSGHHIKSRALLTEITDNEIEDGAGGTASYLIDIPNGGTLTVRGNALEKGPNSENHATAISIGAEGRLQPSDGLSIQNNVFTNDGQATAFVRNATATPAQLTGNVLKGNKTTPLEGPGKLQ